MSVPKKRKSVTAKKQRRSHHALTGKKTVKCSNCGKDKLPHQVCQNCGQYKGRQVIKKKVKKSKNKE